MTVDGRESQNRWVYDSLNKPMNRNSLASSEGGNETSSLAKSRVNLLLTNAIYNYSTLVVTGHFQIEVPTLTTKFM
jgi:hypothetical protein